MKVFNEESCKKPEVILLLSNENARTIFEMAEEACNARPKKTTWKKIKDEMEKDMAMF